MKPLDVVLFSQPLRWLLVPHPLLSVLGRSDTVLSPNTWGILEDSDSCMTSQKLLCIFSRLQNKKHLIGKMPQTLLSYLNKLILWHFDFLDQYL